MTRPNGRWPRRGPDRPEVLEEPPPVRSGVPVERDPVTGRRLAGEPGGRADKQRPVSSRRPRRLPALVAAAGLVLVAATVAVVTLGGGGGDEPAPSGPDAGAAVSGPAPDGGNGSPGGDDAASGGGATGPREVPMAFTVTAVRTAPGAAADDVPTVGQQSDALWLLEGPCDGEGACTLQHCVNARACTFEAELAPTGNGYTGQREFSWFDRPWPECGAVRVAIEVTVSGGADDREYSGTYRQDHGTPLGSDGRGNFCNIPLVDHSFRSV